MPCCWVTLIDVVTLDIAARLMIDLKIRPDLVARNKTVPINTSPETVLQPLVRAQAGCPFRFKIAARDDDGDVVRCRFASGQDDCGGVCGALENAGAQLDTVSDHDTVSSTSRL